MKKNITHGWECESNAYSDFTIHSYGQLDNANPWLFAWCKEHKCPFMRVYVPTHAKYINIDHSGISFTLKPWYKVEDET